MSINTHLFALRNVKRLASEGIELIEKVKNDLGDEAAEEMLHFVIQLGIWDGYNDRPELTSDVLLEIASIMSPGDDERTFNVQVSCGDDIIISYTNSGGWVELAPTGANVPDQG